MLRDIRGSVFPSAFEGQAPPDLRFVSRDSVASRCEGYGLNNPVLESRQGQEIYLFSKVLNTGSGARPASHSMGTGDFSPVSKTVAA